MLVNKTKELIIFLVDQAFSLQSPNNDKAIFGEYMCVILTVESPFQVKLIYIAKFLNSMLVNI